MDLKMDYPFTQEEMELAVREWGCNCGPAALAFACQVPLRRVRHAIPGFAEKGYTSPTMMKAGLMSLGRTFESVRTKGISIYDMCCSPVALVRVQWTGPWTSPGANPIWAYGHTHWIATWRDRNVNLVFDINGGAMRLDEWERDIVPELTAMAPRRDGGWFPTHCWRLVERGNT